MSTSGIKLSVLVPCYNEAEGLQHLTQTLLPSLDRLAISYEVIAIDDGSTDETPTALADLTRKHPHVRLAFHEHNRGLGAALRTGFATARGEWLVCLDADMTFHPDYIGELLKAQRRTGADCVSGSPFLGGMPGVPMARRLPSLLINAFYRGFLTRKLTSFTPMFRLYRTEALRGLELHSNGFEISVEILANLLRTRRKVIEIPTPLTVRVAGVSKLRHWRELTNHIRLFGRLLRQQ